MLILVGRLHLREPLLYRNAAAEEKERQLEARCESLLLHTKRLLPPAVRGRRAPGPRPGLTCPSGWTLKTS